MQLSNAIVSWLFLSFCINVVVRPLDVELGSLVLQRCRRGSRIAHKSIQLVVKITSITY